MEHLGLREEIIAACRRLAAMGYVVGTYGNVSARVPGGLLVTPSRVDYDALAPEDLVTVSDAGRVLDGARLPSSETDVHRRIYARRPDIGAVVHSHSLHATALSCLHETVPVIVEEQSQVVGDEIPCTRYVPAGRHAELGEQVARVLGQANAVLLANHGAVACGRSLEEALFTCVVVERVAQMRLLTLAAGRAVAIPPEHVASERDRFLHRYGRAGDRMEAAEAPLAKERRRA